MMPRAFSDYRFWLLLGALCLALWACLRPQWRLERARAQVLFVVDITRSMNVRDYAAGAQQRSRLEQAKDTVTQALARMPCGSRAGLGVFTERRSFLLLEPMETCANYAALSQTVAELNWRMAWEGDSRIASGLFGALELADTLGANLVFVTDGQEAPPLPASGRPEFEGVPGKVRGLLVGAGGHQPAPIPAYDDDGHEKGFLGPDDVDQENRSGPPPADASQREGWHPRNAPFGGAPPSGNEHLSAVRDTYLMSLAAATGVSYLPLGDAAGLLAAIEEHAGGSLEPAPLDLRPYIALAACLLLALLYGSALLAPGPLRAGRRRGNLAAGVKTR